MAATGSAKRKKPTGSAPSKKRRVSRNTKKRGVKRRARENIKSVVKNVLACQENVGVYTKVYSGDFGSSNTGANTCLLFNGSKRENGNTSPHTTFTMQFTPNSVKRILDAASILYNGKSKSVDIDAAGNFGYQGLKVEVIHSSYKLELWNYTDLDYDVEIHEFTAKRDSLIDVASSMESLIRGENWVGGVPAWTNAAPQFTTEVGFEMGQVKAIAQKYKHKVVKKQRVNVGEMISYYDSYKGCVDFSKHVVQQSGATAPNLASYAKGHKEIVIRLTPVLHAQRIKVTASGNIIKSLASYGTSPDNAAVGWFTVAKEVYKMFQPDETPDAQEGDKRAYLNDVPNPGPGAGEERESLMKRTKSVTTYERAAAAV
jgi:hypothetical protein